jgi:hypothetical protein
MTCPSTAQPDTVQYVCSVPNPQPDGTTGYCCIKSSAGGGSCAPDPGVTGCAFPSYSFSCAVAGDTPDTFDCTLTCSEDQGTGTFCCDENGVCSGGCSDDDALSCYPGTFGVDCTGGADPETSSPEYICSVSTPQSDGSRGYCCATGFGPLNCTQDPSVTGCEGPALGFSCTGPDTPDLADSMLTCSAGVRDPSTGAMLYCCR